MTGSNKKKTILITGPAPTNVGGISKHIRRLVDLLADRCNFDFIDEARNRSKGFFNIRSLNVFTYLRKIRKADVVHINSGAFSFRVLNIIMCRLLMRKYTVVTIHRDPNIEHFTSLMRWLLSKCQVVINVSESGHKLLKTHTATCHYVCMPAYLPANMEKEPELPANVKAWLDDVRKDPKAVVMASNASNLVMHDGVDLYGVDLSIGAMRRLPKNYHLIFVVVKCDIPDFLDAYHVAIDDNSLGDRMLLLDSPLSFVKLIEKCDIVLRTTNTDGDSITVREALALGKPIVASDICSRPEGTILFSNRNVTSLVNAIMSVKDSKSAIPDEAQQDYAAIYSEFYYL